MPLLPEHVHYHIAGSGSEHAAISAAIDRNSLRHRVRLLGRLADADISELYQSSDLLVMPNIPVPGDVEGFGVVILEAGASGTPAIAADLEGMRDVVTEGVNGHLVECRNGQAFARAIMPYVLDRPALKQLARQAAAHTADNYSWEKIAGHYANRMRMLVPSQCL